MLCLYDCWIIFNDIWWYFSVTKNIFACFVVLGAKKDGSSVHFFHRTMNAYSTGQRKRRKIQHHGSTEDHVRWHKTGKTKAVIEDGVHKGYKKIMVLYIRSEKESKSYKSSKAQHGHLRFPEVISLTVLIIWALFELI